MNPFMSVLCNQDVYFFIFLNESIKLQTHQCDCYKEEELAHLLTIDLASWPVYLFISIYSHPFNGTYMANIQTNFKGLLLIEKMSYSVISHDTDCFCIVVYCTGIRS